VVDAHEFETLPAELAARPVRVDAWGGFVFVNPDPHAEPLAEFLDPLPALLAPYRLEDMRFRSYRSTVLPANWKAVVDAFNEGYHVQGLHPQILPWTDDVAIEYEQFRTHAHYGRLPHARRTLQPSPRLAPAGADVDEPAILRGLVAGLGGAFLREERALVDELAGAGLPPGALLPEYQRRRMDLLVARGFDVSAFEPEQMTSADDVYWFPNVVGPIYPGSAILFRVRPNGLDPASAVHDTWVLEWPRPDASPRPPTRAFHADWREHDWGEITTQDYENIARVQRGMRSRGFDGLRCNPRQESNVVHMHRVLDRYVYGDERHDSDQTRRDVGDN
jgi:phenylpropionate dioxygenase-like ring-hydroxylating dioxygenase large terminal subunit